MQTPFQLRRCVVLHVTLLIAALAVSSCRKPPGTALLIENPTYVSTNAKVEGAPPGVGPLECETLGVWDRRGNFVSIMYLSGTLPRGGGQNMMLESTNSFRVYRGTNRIAASNHFLGEYLIADLSAPPPQHSGD